MKAKGIGTLAEMSLHADLKRWCALPGDRMEVVVEDYVVDIVREGLLIEVQTGNFPAIRQKLSRLLKSHHVQLVYPIAQEKWIVKQDLTGAHLTRRKSPKRGRLLDVFYQAVYMPRQLIHSQLNLLLLMTQEEEIWRNDGGGSWRRKGWSILDRRLISVVSVMNLNHRADWAYLLPPDLPPSFTNRDLADGAGIPLHLAQKATYTLVRMGVIQQEGKRGNAYLFRRTA